MTCLCLIFWPILNGTNAAVYADRRSRCLFVSEDSLSLEQEHKAELAHERETLLELHRQQLLSIEQERDVLLAELSATRSAQSPKRAPGGSGLWDEGLLIGGTQPLLTEQQMVLAQAEQVAVCEPVHPLRDCLCAWLPHCVTDCVRDCPITCPNDCLTVSFIACLTSLYCTFISRRYSPALPTMSLCNYHIPSSVCVLASAAGRGWRAQTGPAEPAAAAGKR